MLDVNGSEIDVDALSAADASESRIDDFELHDNFESAEDRFLARKLGIVELRSVFGISSVTVDGNESVVIS